MLYNIKLGAGYPTAQSLAAFRALEDSLGAPSMLGPQDQNYANVWGDGGHLGELATASRFGQLATYEGCYTTYPVTYTEMKDEPINLWTKASNASVDNCDTPVLCTGQGSAEGTPLGTGNVNQ